MCSRQSRKVIWDMINTLFQTTVPVEPTLVAFLQHSQTHFHGLSYQFFQISLKNSELKTTHNAFRDCRVHFSDNLSRNSCMHAIEVWGCTLFARCFKLDYYLRQYSILVIRRNRDMKLWRRITSTNTALSDFSPPQRTRQMRTRSHNYNLVPRAFPLKNGWFFKGKALGTRLA